MIRTVAIALLTLLSVGVYAHQASAETQTVRVVYMVSKDRAERPDFKKAVEDAIRDVQAWYRGQMAGRTFQLHNPVVEVIHSSKDAAWFSQNPNGANRDDWGYNNALSEAQHLLGARVGDTRHVWIVYSDGPGDRGRGAVSFAYLPEDDLLGLIGKHPTQMKTARWIGGLGHELGHAFGLHHPADTKKDYDALMWAGFYEKYPNPTYLTDNDKQTLRKSPFIR